MELPLNIYVFQLQSDHIFVYPTRKIDPTFNELSLEIILYYDFVKKYTPVKIIEILYDQSMTEVDKTVKKYMIFFDFIMVRGGTYFMEVLPDYLEKSLKEELSFWCFIDLPNIDFIENLILLKYRTTDEQIKLRDIFTDTLAQYRKENKLYEELRNYYVGTKLFIIDENVLLRIQEIKQYILDNYFSSSPSLQTSINNEIFELYPTCLIYLRRLLAIVLQYDDAMILRMELTNESIVYIKNPEFILDIFFYSQKFPLWNPPKITQNTVQCAIQICQYYETICQRVLNMIDESAFDVGLYESNFEWKYERAIYYMDWLIKEGISAESINSEAELSLDNNLLSAH